MRAARALTLSSEFRVVSPAARAQQLRAQSRVQGPEFSSPFAGPTVYQQWPGGAKSLIPGEKPPVVAVPQKTALSCLLTEALVAFSVPSGHLFRTILAFDQLAQGLRVRS